MDQSRRMVCIRHIDKVDFKTVKKVYDKYYDFDKFYISSDKKEFK